jgi:CBS domain-containing protein
VIPDPVGPAWLLIAATAWWVGATAAGLRQELVLLGEDRLPEGDYALVSFLRRIQDDGPGLSRRLRISRLASAAFLPLALAAAGPTPHTLVWALLGWFLAAAAEVTGGGPGIRSLGRWRSGTDYALWARFLAPAERIVRALSGIRTGSRESAPPGEVLVAVEGRAAAGGGARLGGEERRFLRRLLASTSILIADIMTRWEGVHWLPVETPVREAAERMAASGRSRAPVLAGKRVVGVVSARNLLPAIHAGGEPPPLTRLLRPVYFVRREGTVKTLLDELREARTHFAVVLDRFGRHVGIVTMEDVLEEIVGGLYDEREREGSRA